MTQNLSVWHLAELPVGMDSERWEEKGGRGGGIEQFKWEE